MPFLTRLVINGGQLFGLHGTIHGVNGDATKISVPSNMDHSSSIDKLVITDQSIVALHTFRWDLIQLFIRSQAVDMYG